MSKQDIQANQGGNQQNQPKQTPTKDQQSQQKQAAQHGDNTPGETETGAEDKTAKR